MIGEYLELQDLIAKRAFGVGRIIQSSHFVTKSIAFPAASPSLGDVTDTAAAIIVGLTAEREWISVHIPIPLFEKGSEADIRVWVHHENAAQEHRLRQLEDNNAEARRASDIEILKELMAKYPEAVEAV